MPPKNRASRSFSLRLDTGGQPLTIDTETRSLDVVCATEGRVKVMDWDSWEPIDEILLMSGCKMPPSRQVPLLDTHSRYSTASVIGSCRNLRVEGSELIGRSQFADLPEVESAWVKMRDGHLTDVSVGYRVDKSVMVPAEQSAVIDGRSFVGPVRVVTAWTIKELSVCPIGADEAAKARAEAQHINKPAEGHPEPKLKEDKSMDERMLEFLVVRGLKENATDEEAYAFLAALPKETVAPAIPDVEGAVRAEVEKERARSAEIVAMGTRFDCADLAQSMVKDGKTVDEAREMVLSHVEKVRSETPSAPFRVSVGLDERDKFRAAAEQAIMIRAGRSVKDAAPGATDLAGYSLREMARHSLMLANAPTGGNVMEMLGRAMVTGDLPVILANTANTSLMSGYESAGETWADWCATGSVSDFKTNTIASVSETSDLDQVTEMQPYKYGEISEAKEQYAIATYGKLFAISRQTIINDDLAALTDIPMKHGEAAARKVGDIAYAVLTANASMRDGVALFHANHGNIGAAGVTSEITIGEAIKMMGLQKDLAGKRRLNIRPEFYIAPITQNGVAETFFSTLQFSNDNKGSTRTNLYSGNRFKRIYESRLDDSSTTAFYLAGPKGKTITVFFLNGVQTPYMETKQGWSVDGVEYKVRIDAGAKALDWKAIVKNAGA